MMKSKIKLNRYTIITASIWAVAAIVLGGGSFLLYLPQKIELARISTQYTESQSALERATTAALDQTKSQQQQQAEEVNQRLSDFSTQPNAVTELVFEIGGIATNDLKLSEFSSKNQQQKKHSTVGKSERVSEVWLSIDFQSTFERFAQFVNRLECHQPAVFIEEISFQRQTDDAAGHKVSLQLSFLTETGNKHDKIASAAY